jgi:hypothetical protein
MLRIETPKGAPDHRQEIQRGRDAGKPRLPRAEVPGNPVRWGVRTRDGEMQRLQPALTRFRLPA